MPNVKLATGCDLYYETHGQGEPLIFVPSTAYSGEVWKPWQMPLAKSLNVIFHDPRGCGRSVPTQELYTIEQMALDIAALMDHLKIPSAHLIGHSMGGRIAQALATCFPRRVRSMVLAASGSGPAGRTGQDCVPGLPFYLVSELVEMGFEEFVRHEVCETNTYFTRDYLKKYPDKVRAFYEMVWKHHAKWRPYLRLCIARHMWEGTHRLADIATPTLVVVGDDDTIGSNHVTQAEVMAKRIPKAEYLYLEGQSHGFFWQAPEETNAWLLDWIKRRS
jgi:pimeloyl-ACP methyl ester carboxylesterase